MRVLVTGANGFVGRHLIKALADLYHVIAVARQEAEIPGAREVRIVPAIDSTTDWSGLLEDVDTVVHLAARVHVMHETAADPLEAFREVNVRGARRLAEACASQGVRRMVFLSSIKVNGEVTDVEPFTWSAAPGPVDPYGISKLEAEEALAQVARESSLQLVVLRSPVIYGLGVKGNIQRLMRLIETRLPLPFGSVRNARSMLSIGNLILWIAASIRSADVPPSPILVSDPEPISTPDLIRSLAEGMGYRTTQVRVPVPLLNLGGKILRQGPALQRLLGDLVVQPTTGPLPQIARQLQETKSELVKLGERYRDGGETGRRMRVLIVSQYYPPEGLHIPETIAQGLVELGYDVRVVTGYPNYPEGKIYEGYAQRWRSRERDGEVDVLRVPLWIDHSQSAVKRILNYTTFALSSATTRGFARGADVVYVYATQMTPSLGPWIWRMTGGAPYVLHVQDLWPDSITGSSLVQKGPATKMIESLLNPWLVSLYRHAAAVIGIAPTMVNMLVARGADPSRTHLVYNWAVEGAAEEPLSFRRAPNLERAATTRIIYGGNVGDMQDLETAVEAVHAARDSGVRLTVVGDGVALPRVLAVAERLGATNIEFKGRVPREQMADLYSRSDYALVTLKDLPAFRGTIPSKLQASLAHGLPVITTVQGDVRTLTEQLAIGFTADTGSVASLETAIRQAATAGPVERQRMAHSAWDAYVSRFSRESGVSAVEVILQDVVLGGSKNGTARERR